jgi:CheY-like chemotaxis protein
MKKPSILIVEDEGLIALQLQELLLNAGYEVPDPVACGEDAIGYLSISRHPDLILMDISLSGELNGIETTRQIWKMADIPVIFITAHYMTGKSLAESLPDFCGVIGKPFTGTDVLSAVENVLDRK